MRARYVPMMLVVALIAAGFYCYGLGSGGTFYHRLVRAPFAPAIDAPYYRASVLHVMLGHVLGLGGSILAFRLAVLACLWAALFYLAGVMRGTLAWTDGCLVLLVLMFHPSAMIAYAWTCHPDAVTYLLTAVLLFSRRPWVLAAVAALGAWNHLAMWAIVCVEAALLWWAFIGAQAKRPVIATAAGLVVGAVSCKLTLMLCGVEIVNDRLALAWGQEFAALVGYWTLAGWPILYTLYFAHIVWVPIVMIRLYRERPRLMWVFLATQLLALAAACCAQDTTRVFAFLAWGPLVYCLVHVLAARSGRAGLVLRIVVGAAVVATIVGPKIFAWKGDIRDTEGARAHLRAVWASASRAR
ncbi:MAG TPA: hypothetical protein VGB85_01620 [Nannocystis sp.]|jgi:hypothetical protein